MARCWEIIAGACLMLAAGVLPGKADPLEDCNSSDVAKMLSGCTAVLETATTPEERLAALVRRGFAEKQSDKCEAAIADLSIALQLAPKIERWTGR